MQKELVIFDLDGTLAVSKWKMDVEMAQLLEQLSHEAKIAIISGGKYEQFLKQVVPMLTSETQLEHVFFFPTSGASFYRWWGQWWENIYAHNLSPEQIQSIFDAFPKAIEQSGIQIGSDELHGEQLEDRQTQVSWSALGQQCPIELKETWDPDQKKRLQILPYLQEMLPDFDVRVGGTTTIDVTKKGLDKKYGIEKMHEHLAVAYEDMFFVGDAIFPGGNDYACVQMWLDHAKVETIEDTKKVIQNLLAS